jgi:hypothetical protein
VQRGMRSGGVAPSPGVNDRGQGPPPHPFTRGAFRQCKPQRGGSRRYRLVARSTKRCASAFIRAASHRIPVRPTAKPCAAGRALRADRPRRRSRLRLPRAASVTSNSRRSSGSFSARNRRSLDLYMSQWPFGRGRSIPIPRRGLAAQRSQKIATVCASAPLIRVGR